ncbi:trihelix transcription factor ASIL1 [Pyrus x bretschneideri]|uniref:trihelix transcription factor ASIL1 n=1 Tax=Pyrus x bretschneideri TaxID=225117 RepID=UPI0020306FB9|nr:trihelix transcription factor ASIL1 [Pyrus x bretschneideri]
MNRRTRTHAPAGREDCWNEADTEALITAWGDRYLHLNHGILRQKEWKEVADAVNSTQNGGVKPSKTDVQCRNRIDTLKKKYKLEKSKSGPSKWPFYRRLHSLICSTPSNAAVSIESKPPILALTGKSPDPSPYPLEGSRRDDGGDEAAGLSVGAVCRELARAISRFGEMYERIENSKRKQMMELEKQRMEFDKELELQRLNMFMDVQVDLGKKMKLPTYSHSSGPAIAESFMSSFLVIFDR